MVTNDLQTLNLKFDKVMFYSLFLMGERNFEVTLGIFSVLGGLKNLLRNGAGAECNGANTFTSV